MKSKQKLIAYFVLLSVLAFYVFCVSVQISNTEVLVDGWGYNATRDASQYVLTNLSAHILPEHFCDFKSFLLVMVCSGPSNAGARAVIRETWGHKRTIIGTNVSLFFLLGETANSSLQYDVMMESDRYGDIAQERFLDSYNNLTLKSISMLKLVSSYCANSTKYLLKIDDDMWVNLPLIVRMLMDANSTSDLLVGKLICGAKPIKDTTSKWYSPSYMYPGKVYPNYLSGTGYVMSIAVAEKLYGVALKTPIFHLEDVFVTGICAKAADVRPRNNPLFTYQKLNYNICQIMRLHTAHRFTPEEIRKTHRLLQDSNVTRECSTQKTNFSVNHWILNNLLKVNKTHPLTLVQKVNSFLNTQHDAGVTDRQGAIAQRCYEAGDAADIGSTLPTVTSSFNHPSFLHTSKFGGLAETLCGVLTNIGGVVELIQVYNGIVVVVKRKKSN